MSGEIDQPEYLELLASIERTVPGETIIEERAVGDRPRRSTASDGPAEERTVGDRPRRSTASDGLDDGRW
jgi:hypothetical protein